VLLPSVSPISLNLRRWLSALDGPLLLFTFHNLTFTMARITISALVALLSALSLILAASLEKQIDQIISESTRKWEQACVRVHGNIPSLDPYTSQLKAGGAQQCNPISVAAFTTLLAAAKNCDQQDNADKMIDLAKKLKKNSEMIRLTQLFVQQPRNAVCPTSLPRPAYSFRRNGR